jgi:hypothetical protein
MAQSLTRKLRIQPTQCVLILNALTGYIELLADLPEGVQV